MIAPYGSVLARTGQRAEVDMTYYEKCDPRHVAGQPAGLRSHLPSGRAYNITNGENRTYAASCKS